MIHCGVGIILNTKAQVLLAQRNADDSFGNYWEFPGGKQEIGESLDECVVREVKEEADIHIQITAPFHELINPYKDQEISLHFFLCQYMSGDPKPLESQKIQWTNMSSLKEYQFPPANEIIIQKLLQHHSIHSRN
ncbi:MAG: mutator protein MutT [Candidatus Omnitrophota bacterium]|jgi:mutator protein MutT